MRERIEQTVYHVIVIAEIPVGIAGGEISLGNTRFLPETDHVRLVGFFNHR